MTVERVKEEKNQTYSPLSQPNPQLSLQTPDQVLGLDSDTSGKESLNEVAFAFLRLCRRAMRGVSREIYDVESKREEERRTPVPEALAMSVNLPNTKLTVKALGLKRTFCFSREA